eukprot:CAMPEP_0117421304 /NCGR_PEP_ID=MMETSP0758-20121206/2437_1 /TAXON_ID=63605 /ORGANISM="Percolomonas cosmopolitus, Strain AE-1 (ATCC 50343)" /LENGTH=454 /DNA_ID=CAMNT_0005203377 /DNA_START=147 /DNA_END=1508 /DNA_ORIENTATION=-
MKGEKKKEWMNKIDTFAKALSDQNEIKNTYLNTSWLDTKEFYQRIDTVQANANRRQSRFFPVSAPPNALEGDSASSHGIRLKSYSTAEGMEMPPTTNQQPSTTLDPPKNNQPPEEIEEETIDDAQNIHLEVPMDDVDTATSSQIEMETVQATIDTEYNEEVDKKETIIGLDQAIARDTQFLNELRERVRIKIIITELGAITSTQRALRQIVSPVFSQLNILPDLGAFHSALLIGPWILDWNDSSLCIPRKCVSKYAFYTADLDSITTIRDVNKVINTLSERIVYWNTHMKYRDYNNMINEGANCQEFVEDILKALHIDLDALSKPHKAFFKQLRTKGVSELRFTMDDTFWKKFDMESDFIKSCNFLMNSEHTITFRNHKELDIFVHYLESINTQFKTEYKSEYSFLKGFDRAFWLRTMKFSMNPDWKPLRKSELPEALRLDDEDTYDSDDDLLA